MGERTKIAWCDHTFNPWRGCSKVSAGCANCYAERQSRRNPAVLGVWGEDGTRVVAADAYWRLPERWERAAAKEGVRRRVFLGSLMDFFEPWPDLMRYPDGERTEATMEALRRRVFALIDRTPHLDWLIVTKRPENIRRMWPRHASGQLSGPSLVPTRLGNVWLLASVEDQAAADTRIPHLLACRDLVPVLGLSCEPLLGPVDIGMNTATCNCCERWPSRWVRLTHAVGPDLPHLLAVEPNRVADAGIYRAKSNPHGALSVPTPAGPLGIRPPEFVCLPGLDWVIAGGESGPSARPCDVAWIRSLRDQCQAAGVPFFAKQVGANRTNHGAALVSATPRERGGWRDPAGADPAEWPEDLRVREFPEATP